MLTTLLVLALANTLSPDQIASAIAEGVKLKDKPWTIGLRYSSGAGGFDVAAFGPQNRISVAAAMAAARYEPFSHEQVAPEMSAALLSVHATPHKPEPVGITGMTVTPAATHMVLRPKTGPVIQPVNLELVPASWSNAMGGHIDGQGVHAVFDLTALPAGDVDVVIVTNGGEQVRTIKAKDRAKIR